MNTPRNNLIINADDPKWTAYVLGEVNEAERAEIERLLEASEEARALVEELTLATASMKEELSSFLPLMMSPEQRAAIRSAAEPKPRRWFEVFPSKWGLGLAAAAVIVMAVAVPFALREPQGVPTVAESENENDLITPPEVTIVRNDPAVTPEKDLADAAAKKSERRQQGAATAAPVVTAEQFKAIARDDAPAANPAAVTPPPITTGVLAGTVQDPSSAFIPGVTITATNTSTGIVVNTITNESGAYRLPTVQPGTYQISAALPGFQTQTVTNLPVGPRDEARVNYTLQVAAVSTSLEVSVSADKLLQSNSASVGEVLTVQRVTQLPLVGNNVLDLISIMPGFRDAKEETVAGLRQAESVNVTRDGLSVDDARFAKAAAPPPPPPGGPPSASTLGIDTRSGTNRFEGQGQQGQQGQGAPAGGGGGGGAGGRGGAARGVAAPALSSTAINPDTVGEIRLVLTPVDGELGRGNSQVQVRAAAPPPPPPPAPAPPPPPARPVAGTLAAAAAARAPIDNNARSVPNTEAYDRVTDNPFIRTTQENLATFSIDVDTASYSNVRRFLNQNQLPPADAVRIEELINYFSYDYAQPTGNAPIAPNMEVAATPWHPTNRLVRIGIKAREVNANRRPPSNLVFLIDVSGSMNSPERLPLVKAGLGMLVERLGENDTVSIVVYAGQSGLALAPTSGMRKEAIRQAIDSLQPGGSTNGASGIQLAYNQATANFLRGGVNRVILMTDGDFNVGVTNQGDLTRLIEDRARSGVFLSVLGFGMGNYKDSTLEKLADQGNGNYAYIDNIAEARKVLVEEMSSTLVTVAKDVKIQVDFNPARVEAYRLIGYENRILRTQDFNNDAKDAGDMGAGHTVTALFEVVPKGGEVPGPSIDPSIYTQPRSAAAADATRPNAGANSNEMLTLRVRYKQPDSDTSTRMDVPLVDRGTAFARASTDFRFAAGVAEFGMILRGSPYRGSSRMDTVLDIVEGSQGADRNGYRREFITLVQKARTLGR